jgi:hypothetical protein
MVKSRSVAIAAAAALVAAVAAYSLGAQAQTAASGRVVGYAVFARSHYVLLQRADGRLRSCVRPRETMLRDAAWRCEQFDAAP